MLTHNELKYYSSLLQKKYRSAERKFIVEGRKIVEDGLGSNFKCEIIFVTNKFKDDNEDFCLNLKSSHRLEIIKNSELFRLTDTRTPQGIAAVFEHPVSKQKVSENRVIVLLEEISDPGNLGTIIRTCDWFGIKKIYLSEKCAEIYNPKTIRASMGSIFHVEVVEDLKIDEVIKKFKDHGYKIYCADTEGENIFNAKVKDNLLLIFSNESKGPSKTAEELCDKKITIPKIGQAESLNVASACAIILAEVSRKA
jgi:RNA methyltransferase, TrmH family